MKISEERISDIIKEELQNYYNLKNKKNNFNKALKRAAQNVGIKLNENDFVKIRSLIKEQGVLDFTPAIEIDLDDVKEEKHNSKMAKSQLFHIAKEAQSLHDQLKDDDEIPQWAKAKIAVMADNMDSVADHLGYKIHRGDL